MCTFSSTHVLTRAAVGGSSPVIAPFSYVLSGTPLGIARGVLDNYVDGMQRRVAQYTGLKIAGLPNIQIKVAEAAAAIDAAPAPSARLWVGWMTRLAA